MAGGDFNAKQSQWGSRLISSKARQLLSETQILNLNTISNEERTYWQSDVKKKPDFIDFFITKALLWLVIGPLTHDPHSP